MAEIFVGRQPIFDRQLNVSGYELLYRTYKSDRARVLDGDLATSQVILNTFAEIGLEKIVGKQKAYINITRNFFLDKYPLPFQPQQVVLEVLEDIPVDEDLVRSLRSLRSRGYQIALDDVVDPYRFSSILSLIDIVKLDLQEANRARLKEYVLFLRQYNVGLLAEKVETLDEFELCKRLGFDYFQGYFLCKPKVVRGKRVQAARPVVLSLLSKLQDPDVGFGELEGLIAQDVSLSYKVLRLVNSAYYGLATTVDSIRQALTFMGLDQIRGWLTLFILAEIGDKPAELTVIAAIRAKMCELIGRKLNKKKTPTYFMVGILSVLDALMDLPMESALESLPITEEIVAALLHHQGEYGEILHYVIAYERAEWDQVASMKIDSESLREIYLKSIK